MRLFIMSVSVLLILNFTSITSDVVDSFSTCNEFFLNKKPPVIPGILENSVSKDQNVYKIICQKHDNKYRFATLYDTTKKIPVFSAYKYTGGHKKPSDWKKPNWRIEPEIGKDLISQARKNDYCKNTQNVNRGHLFPRSHAADVETAKSTYTMTNAVPQYIKFNGGSWAKMERKTQQIMDKNCRDNNDKVLAYVVTGALPSVNNRLKDTVNIPSHMWTAFCCSKTGTWVSQAHWAKNEDENTSVTIEPRKLEKLHQFLNTQWNKGGITLFDNECNTLLTENLNLNTNNEDQDDTEDICEENEN